MFCPWGKGIPWSQGLGPGVELRDLGVQEFRVYSLGLAGLGLGLEGPTV